MAQAAYLRAQVFQLPELAETIVLDLSMATLLCKSPALLPSAAPDLQHQHPAASSRSSCAPMSPDLLIYHLIYHDQDPGACSDRHHSVQGSKQSISTCYSV